MPTSIKGRQLGRLIKRHRLAKGLSLRALAAQTGYAPSYLCRIEAGDYETPAPKTLQAIARVLDIPIEDLYALTNYDMPGQLPNFAPYLRAKYDQLPDEAVEQLEDYFEMLKQRYGARDGGEDA